MRFLSIDPGEDTGWAIWEDTRLVEAGTDKLWDFIDEFAGPLYSCGPDWGPLGVLSVRRFDRVICEDWALYPWSIKGLSWDKCRTARGIGAIELTCRVAATELVLQPASIKDSAIAAGAQDLFLTPLHENRHANDAISHGIHWQARQRMR